MADAAVEGVTAYNARAAGLEAEQANWRKQKAMDALTNIYGPIAGGDPEDALKTQNYLTATQQDPLKTEALRLNNAGTGTANAQAVENLGFSTQQHPLQLQQDQNVVDQGGIKTQADQLGLNTDTALAPLKVAQGQNEVTGGGIANAANADALTAAQAARQRASAQGLLATLSDAYNNGGDIGRAFDQIAPQIAALEGVDPNHLQPLRQQFVADPAGTINHLQTALAAANPPPATAGGTAAQRAANSPQARNAQADALEVIQGRTSAVPTTIDQATALIPKMSASAILRKARAQIPGTPEYQFEALTHSIGANLSLDDLRSLKQTGLSLGRVSNVEFVASQHAFGNLDLGQDPGQIASTLSRLGTMYKQINSNIGVDVQRLRAGASPHLEQRPPTATPDKPAKITGGVSPAALDGLIKKAGGIDAAIAATADNPDRAAGDNIARALADRWATLHPAKAAAAPSGSTAKPLSDADLFKKYGVK